MASSEPGSVNQNELSVLPKPKLGLINENELPDVPDFPIPDMVSNFLISLTRKQIAAAFFSYVLYDYEGRKLDRKEVTAMIRLKYQKKLIKFGSWLFDSFEDPNLPLTKSLRDMVDKSYQSWWVHVDSWFKELRDKEPAFKAKADAIRRMKGRLGDLYNEDKKLPLFCGKRLEEYHLCFIHAVNHWVRPSQVEPSQGEPSQGKPIPWDDKVMMVKMRYGLEGDTNQTIPQMKKLAKLEPEFALNRAVRVMAEKHKDLFEPQALEVATKYWKRKEEMLKEQGKLTDKDKPSYTKPQLKLGVQEIYSVGSGENIPTRSFENDSVQAVSQSMASSSLGAGTSAYGPPAPNPVVEPKRNAGQPRFHNRILGTPEPSERQGKSTRAERKGGEGSSGGRQKKDRRSDSPERDEVGPRRESDKSYRERMGLGPRR